MLDREVSFTTTPSLYQTKSGLGFDLTRHSRVTLLPLSSGVILGFSAKVGGSPGAFFSPKLPIYESQMND